MKLYFSKGACSLAIRITINELGIPCEYESVNLKTKETANGADFLKINPKGSVPVLQLNDNTFLTEGAAIQQYLADSNKADQLLPPVGNIQRYHVIEWLTFIATELHKGCGVFFSSAISDQIKNDVFRPMLINKLKLVEQQLAKSSFISGNQFSLADSYLFVILNWLQFASIDIKDFPHTAKYFATLAQRPSVMKSLKEEGFM